MSCHCTMCEAGRDYPRFTESFSSFTGISNADGKERDYATRFIRPFLAKGWKQMDVCGCFTRIVLLSPDNQTVLKLSGDYYGMDWNDRVTVSRDGFKDFAMWAARQSSVYLPKIYHVGALRKFGLFVTVMERLTKIDENFFQALEYNDIERTVEPYEWDIYNVLKLSEAFRRQTPDLSRIDRIFAVNFAKLIKRMIDALGNPTDLHTGNIMLRGKTPVLLDPYAKFN